MPLLMHLIWICHISHFGKLREIFDYLPKNDQYLVKPTVLNLRSYNLAVLLDLVQYIYFLYKKESLTSLNELTEFDIVVCCLTLWVQELVEL